jgi:hypothetical protein
MKKIISIILLLFSLANISLIFYLFFIDFGPMGFGLFALPFFFLLSLFIFPSLLSIKKDFRDLEKYYKINFVGLVLNILFFLGLML